jgi:hypothetical protein
MSEVSKYNRYPKYEVPRPENIEFTRTTDSFDILRLFFNDDVFEVIVINTNSYAVYKCKDR